MFRIAITGPESSGKSSLSIALAQALKCSYLPEYARFYLQEKQGNYSLHDLNQIIDRQVQWIAAAMSKPTATFLVADTDFLVLDIWEEVRFSSCSTALNSAKKQYPFDLILLCYPDLPWEDDPLRESNGQLDWLFDKYLLKVQASGVPFAVIQGKDRLQQALKMVHKKKDR